MVNLRWNVEAISETRTIDAIRALTRRRMGMMKAKRAIEATLARRENCFHVPMVEDPASLQADLEQAGFKARIDMQQDRAVDIQMLRKKLGTTQEQFAARFRIGLDVLRNWEQHVNEPNAVARNMLELIARDPEGMAARLWEGL